jgi:predicted ATPase/DNA-binding SARP family transcriptional activator
MRQRLLLRQLSLSTLRTSTGRLAVYYWLVREAQRATMVVASVTTPAAAGLRLQLLGRFRLERDAQPVHLPRRKVESLLAYLALKPQAHARERLAALLWGDAPDVKARHSLRTALGILRQHLGVEILLADRDFVQLNPAAPIWVDALEFHRQAMHVFSGPSPELAYPDIELYQGDLLSEFYDDWVLAERERFHSLYVNTLLQMAAQMRSRGEHGHAIDLARKVLAADPTNELAHQQLMLCFAATGNRSAAMWQFVECRRILREQLAVEPGTDTLALYERIKQAASEPAAHETSCSNLPLGLSSFIGRRREMNDVKAWLAETRLFTITGAGGSGKTRLAIQVAAEIAPDCRDGAWLVELAGLANPALVPQAVASALGVRETQPQSLMEALISYLRSKQMLIVLDNCEHLIEACAQLAAALLSACPGLQILATSREALGLTGEVAWQIPTLSLPGPGQSLPIQALQSFEAIELFIQRAVAVQPNLALTPQSATAVQAICQRLDGLPLAIELAAARVKILSVEQIAAQLAERNHFNLLSTGSRIAAPRHQTLRAMIDWSHDLLDEQEKVAFRRLSVFAGGFTLAAASAVCTGGRDQASDMVNLLGRLVDKSLVMMEFAPGQPEPRYRLLETIRQYAFEKLEEAHEAGPAQSQHAQFYLKVAEEAEPGLMTGQRGRWMERLAAEYGNLRAALEWAEAAAEGEVLLRLAGALAWFWVHGSTLSEGRGWLTRALARDFGPNEIWPRAKGLFGAGLVAEMQGEHAAAEPLLTESIRLWRTAGSAGQSPLAYALASQCAVARAQGNTAAAVPQGEEAVALFREQGDQAGLAYALSVLGFALRDLQQYGAAQVRLDESVAVWRGLGDPWGLALALGQSGMVATRQGNYDRAHSLLVEAQAAFSVAGDKQGMAVTLHDLGIVRLNVEDEAGARPYFEESLALGRETGNQFVIALNALSFGNLTLYEGDDVLAQSYYRQTYELTHAAGPRWYKSNCLKGWAGLAAVRGQARRAARLWGAAEAQLAGAGNYMDNSDCIFFGRILSRAQAQLGEAAFETARAEGRRMSLEEAMAYAQATDDTA